MTRMSASGNTFIIIESEKENFSFTLTVEKQNYVQRLCQGYPGMFTDGVVFIEKSLNMEVDFQWDFYNADGSTAEMCGNAARCAALYYSKKNKQQKTITFQTKSGIINAEVIDFENNIIKVSMPQPNIIAEKFDVLLEGRAVQGFFVNTGVPHFVILEEPNENLAKALRQVKNFGKAGANITFVDFESSDFIQAVTFERGVEDFTLACGTGAVAAAAMFRVLHPEDDQQTIEMPGGLLIVEWDESRPQLIGPAEFHFDMKLYEVKNEII